QPQPERRIPLWVGGASDAAIRRAVDKGDGWHGTYMEPEAAAPLISKLREKRPELDFSISMRTSWDGLATDAADIRKGIEAFAELGLQHLMAAPVQGGIDDWLKSVEKRAGT